MKNSSTNNSRVVINHGYDQFEEGNDYILTLEDKPILTKTDELNEDNQLELSNNSLLSKKPPRECTNKIKENQISSRDQPFNKVNPSMKSNEIINNEEMEEIENKIVLNSEGTFNMKKRETLERIKNRFTYKNKGTNLETPKIFNSDFESKETSIFKKPGKIRKKIFDENILEHLEETSKQYEKEQDNQLPKEISKNSKINLDSWLSNIDKDKSENKLAYNIALKKAEIENNLVFKSFQNDEDEYENEISKQIASRIKNQKKFEINAEILKKYDNQESKENEDKKKEMKLIEETDILIKNIESKNDLQEVKTKYQNSQFSVKDSKAGVESIVNIPLYSELILNQQRNIQNTNEELISKVKDVSLFPMNTTNEMEKKQTSKNIGLKNDKEKNSDFSKEPLVGRGIANSIVIFRSRGMLKNKDAYSIDYDKDNTERNLLPHSKRSYKTYDYSHIEIIHRDKEGNIQTPKEAFVEQSRFYHSLGPSKKKQEKLILKKRKELEKKRTDQLEGSIFMKALEKNQEKKNQPHLILSSKSHTIL